MIDDFSNRQCYAGEGDAAALRARIEGVIVETLRRSGYFEVADEGDAMRSLVVGPPGRWIFVGDTAGSTTSPDTPGFAAVSAALSRVLPVADVHMRDSVAIHFYLHREGAIVDKYGSAAWPDVQFKSDEEAAEFRGDPAKWAAYLLDPRAAGAVRKLWVQDAEASTIAARTAAFFGWEIWKLGYTRDEEGLAVKYDEILAREGRSSEGFTELHFGK